MTYPKSKKTCKRYATYLSELHGKSFVPIEFPEKGKVLINFAAVEVDELSDYLSNGWTEII